ncbi:MAG: hypothetical protein ACTHMZ_11415, partial [Actinomycetes bacterium]
MADQVQRGSVELEPTTVGEIERAELGRSDVARVQSEVTPGPETPPSADPAPPAPTPPTARRVRARLARLGSQRPANNPVLEPLFRT